MKLRRKDGWIREEDLLSIIENEWITLDRLFADFDEKARQNSLAALGMLLNQLGYSRLMKDELVN